MLDRMMRDVVANDWKKSSYSVGANNCVEVAAGRMTWAAVRDSKNQGGPALVVGASSFGRFVSALRPS